MSICVMITLPPHSTLHHNIGAGEGGSAKINFILKGHMLTRKRDFHTKTEKNKLIHILFILLKILLLPKKKSCYIKTPPLSLNCFYIISRPYNVTTVIIWQILNPFTLTKEWKKTQWEHWIFWNDINSSVELFARRVLSVSNIKSQTWH